MFVRRRHERELTLHPVGPPRGVILYHHGYTEPHDRLLRDPDRPVTEALLESGFVVASSSACGDSWGSRRSVEANLRLWQRVGRPDLPLGHLGISMGCLVALNCAADERFPSRAVAGIAAVCDVESVRPYRPVSRGAVNPMDRHPHTWQGISFRFWSADEEAPVSRALNADRFADSARPYARESTVVACLGNHTSADQYQPADVLAYFDRALGADSST